MDEGMQDLLSQSLARFFSPNFQSFFKAINKVANYELPDKHKTCFREFHSYITSPQPNFISELRSDPKKEHWYILLVNGVLGNAQQSFACVAYHQERLKNIESNLIEIINTHKPSTLTGESTWGLGGTSVLDFEYQAYVLAYRRCLDQFARGMGAFFKNQSNSFRTFPAFLERQKPQDVARSLSEIHGKYAHHFEFVFSEGGITSVRDRIAHYEFVPAGCMNISSRGVMFVGGGENLNLNGENLTLTETLSKKTEILYECIAEVIRAFIQSASQWENSKEASGSI
ncbi:hypothetical protein [Pseudomonas syringae]|uniref:hypothetical protein n=1 Tax=Pseudomonas syringae TaxID=317 RepID=UPI00200A4993|nr:hypothetical protein [Pseudomonas syringae]MCK9704968.1 hypothetical protein [Pseudomonas syringae pv. syringae]